MLSVINALSKMGSDGDGFEPKKVVIKRETKKGMEEMYLPGVLNPTQLKLDRKANWQGTEKQGGSKPFYDYTGGMDDLDFTITLDASETDNDLTNEIEALYDLTYPLIREDKAFKKGRPPVVNFSWGDSFKFGGVVKSVGITVTLFDEKGAFKRATVAIKMEGLAFQTVSKAFLHEPPKTNKEAAEEDTKPVGGSSGPFGGFPF